MSDQQFDAIAALAYRECGITLVPQKKLMVQSRLRQRLRALELNAFAAYAEHLASPHGASERRFMISALTTNVSRFFRDAHQFDLLSDRLMSVFRKKIKRQERIRIWSAGCSKGQEPYSIAMHLLRQQPALAAADFKILGTDIDPQMIASARSGVFDHGEMNGLPAENLNDFTIACGARRSRRKMSEKLTEIVSFQELNLFDDWPMQTAFDAVFCRNVAIYFDQAKQVQLWPRFNHVLTPGGLLFLGHSERISNPSAFGFRSAGPTAYAKTCNCNDGRS